VALGSVAVAGVALAATGPLVYPPSLSRGVPDASVNGDGVTELVEACPDTHPHATGGGAEIVGDQTGLDLELKSSSALTGGTGPDEWDVQANNSSGSPASMTMSIVCAKGSFRAVTTLASVPSGDARTRTATCPKGTKLAGGGVFSVGGDHATEIGDSAPEGTSPPFDSWTGTINNGSSDTVQMGVRAMCADRGTYRVKETPTQGLSPGAQVAATARCAKGSQVTGGGVRISGLSNDLEVASSAPFDGPDAGSAPDDGWHGVANNDGSGPAETMRTFAVCKS
jgi:hypothetical protein